MNKNNQVIFNKDNLRKKADNQGLDSTNNSSESQISILEWSFWSVFISTFLTIFLAEIGDKTQLATLLLAAQSGSPWLVFTGATLALISTSLLGVLIGYWLSKKVTPKFLDFFLVLLLLLVAGWLLADVVTI
jgi:putative Ca2+/H+ antiporter (TMEM165/GDT1 family)